MRILVRALLPLGEGTVLDPFMGSGSTLAAAEAVGYPSIGIELDQQYFALAQRAVPQLAVLYPRFRGEEMELLADYRPALELNKKQLDFSLAEKRRKQRAKSA